MRDKLAQLQNRKVTLVDTGFSVVELIVVIVIVIALALGGWAIYRSHHKTSHNTSTNNSKQTSQQNKSTSPPPDPTASWSSYSSPGNNYTMRIPDGWNLLQNCTGPTAQLLLYDDSGNTLAIKQGTKGIVTDQCFGRDATPVLSIQWYDLTDSTMGGQQLLDSLSANGVQQEASFKTDSGLTVQKYYLYVSQDPQDSSQPQKGTYYYYVIKNGNKFVYVQYYFTSGETDYHSNVEDAVKTIQLNS